MARPHILFIQAQDLPWQQGYWGEGRDDVKMKLLSLDESGTDGTCVLRYEPGWRRDSLEYLSCHEEFLVLDGAITINGQRYDKHTYGFLPAGFAREEAVSEDGAVCLTMFYDRPVVHAGEPPEGLFDPRLLVPYVNPLEMEWDPGLVDPQLSAGVAIKPLREDPYTKEVSFLYMSPPHRVPPDMAKPQWTHPMVEELYTIEGEYVWGDCGRMGPGGYCWWREGVYHGPAGTDTGYHLFVRTVNGPLVNNFATEKKPFTWQPQFKPQIPDELKQYAKPYKREPNY